MWAGPEQVSNAIGAKKFSEFLFVNGDILGFLEAMSVFRAPVTRTLVAINVAAYILMLLALWGNGAQAESIFSTFALVPSMFWNQAAIWQPLTSMFMHGGHIHILFNMITIWSLGSVVEHRVGPGKFTALYFISGFSGAALILLASIWELPGAESYRPVVGASGALFGLIAALVVFYPNARVLLFFVFPMKVRTLAIGVIIVSIFLQLMQWGLVGDESSGVFGTLASLPISHLGHLGGFFGGLLFVWLAIAPSKEERMDPGPAMGGGFRMGTRRTGPSHTTGPEEQVLRMMQELMRQRQSGATGPGPAPGERRTVKEINPIQDSERFDEPPSNKPERGESDSGSAPGSGRLYYDPASGRFFFK